MATTPRNYPKPEGGDPFAPRAAIADLADAVDADVQAVDTAKAAKATTITAGTGLTGGGDLSANRTLAVSYGTTAGTAAQGNDARLSDQRVPTDGSVTEAKIGTGAVTETKIGASAVTSAKIADGTIVNADINASAAIARTKIDGTPPPSSLTITAGTGLTGGGDLSANRTLAVSYGTTAGTAAQGNDSRITGAVQSSLVDAKGDLLAGTADNTVARLAVGANNQVLVADSAATAGVKWANVAPETALRLLGTGGNYVSTPEMIDYTTLTELEVIAVGSVNVYAGLRAFAAHFNTTTSQRSWLLGTSGNSAYVALSGDGVNVVSTTRSLSGSVSAGSVLGLRFAWRANNGSGVPDLRVWFSADQGVTWDGPTTVTASVPAALHNSTHTLIEIGSRDTGTGGLLNGAVKWAEIKANGSTVASFDARAPMGPRYSDAQGNVWTINGSAWTWSRA